MQLLINFVSLFLDLLSFAILARIILSWVNSPGAYKIKMFINDITDPVLVPFQKPIFKVGMIDLSPMVVLILLDITKGVLLSILSRIYF
jgi:YggT family protein